MALAFLDSRRLPMGSTALASIALAFAIVATAPAASRGATLVGVAPDTVHSGPRNVITAGQLTRRELWVKSTRFRRDGDPLGGKGEVTYSWTAQPHNAQGQYVQSGTSSMEKHKHSKKKCDDGDCSSHSGNCNWHDWQDRLTYTDWSATGTFCNPIQIDLQFKEDGKSIGSCFPVDLNSSNDCEARDLSTPSGKPAKVEFHWEIIQEYQGALAGPSCHDSTTCGAVEAYQFGQVDASLWCRMTTETVNLLDPTALGTRLVQFAFDTDANQITGSQEPNFCGADWRLDITLQHSGGPPTYTMVIERWNGSNWQLEPGAPLDFTLATKLMDLKLPLSLIGNPAPRVVSWVVFSQNAFVSGTMPCFPCVDRLVVLLEPDTRCPYVLDVDASGTRGGDGTGPILVRFSEPMANITTADVSFSPPLQNGYSVTVSQSDVDRLLSVHPVPRWPVGNYQIVLSPTITDQAGNLLAASANPADCGSGKTADFCSEESDLMITNSGGAPVTQIPLGAPVFAKGGGFAPNTSLPVYLVQQDAVDLLGSWLADFSGDGITNVTTDGTGNLPLSNLGIPVVADEYSIVVDTDHDGILGVQDRVFSRCGIGVTAGNLCDDLPGPPLAQFSFDQVSGTVAPSRGGAPQGTLHMPPTWLAGRLNGALEFAGGSGVWITQPAAADLAFGDTDFSIAVWVRPTLQSGTIVSNENAFQGQGYALYLEGGRPRFEMNDGSGSTIFGPTSSPSLVDGNWHLLVLTVDRASTTGLHFYQDDAMVFTGDPTPRSGSINSTNTLFIGDREAATGMAYVGRMDELGFYDEPLTAAEVRSLFLQTSGDCPQTVSVPQTELPAPRAMLSAPRVAPNPARGPVAIDYTLPAPGFAELSVYDVAGRRAARLGYQFTTAGEHHATWDLRDENGARLAAGRYIVTIKWNGIASSRNVAVLN